MGPADCTDTEMALCSVIEIVNKISDSILTKCVIESTEVRRNRDEVLFVTKRVKVAPFRRRQTFQSKCERVTTKLTINKGDFPLGGRFSARSLGEAERLFVQPIPGEVGEVCLDVCAFL